MIVAPMCARSQRTPNYACMRASIGSMGGKSGLKQDRRCRDAWALLSSASDWTTGAVVPVLR